MPLCLAIGLLVSTDPVSYPQLLGSQNSSGNAVQPATPEVAQGIAEAMDLLQKGSPAEAEKSVRRYLGANQNSAAAHFLLGQILFTQQRAKESLAEYTEGAKYQQPSAFDLKVVALDYILLFDYADADKWLTRSLQWNSQDSQSWYYLGRTKYYENRFQEAIDAFAECLKRDARNVKAEDNIGLSYQGLGRPQAAISAFQTAIAWQAGSANRIPQPYIDLASLLLEQNRTEESISYLRDAVEIAPNDSKAHEQLGKAYVQKDELQKAQVELEKATELSPQTAPLRFELGQVYRKEGLIDKAKAEFERYSTLTDKPPAPKVSGPPE